jgi:hypothetical protein
MPNRPPSSARSLSSRTSIFSGATGSMVGTSVAPETYPLPPAVAVAVLSLAVPVVFRVLDLVEQQHVRQLEHAERPLALCAEHAEHMAFISKANPDHLSEVAVAWSGQPVFITTSRTTGPAAPADIDDTAEPPSKEPPRPALRTAG